MAIAAVVKLVDTPALGAGSRKGMRVRVSPAAHMKEEEKKKILQRLLMRVQTGLFFIKTDYLARHKKTDVLWIRNIYILLSFYTELFLKMIYVFSNDFDSLADMDTKLRGLRHDLGKIGCELKKGVDNFGINNISLKDNEYCIETEYGTFYVKDFIDIRYDFLDDSVRILNGDEHNMFNNQIEIMLKISKKLQPLIRNLKSEQDERSIDTLFTVFEFDKNLPLLDLHGVDLFSQEIEIKTINFLCQAQYQGQRAVQIVYGKGASGALKGRVVNLLGAETSKNSDSRIVKAWREATLAGAGGRCLVLLEE